MGKKYPIDEVREGMVLEEGVYGGKRSRVPLVAKHTVLTNFLIGKMKDNDVKEVKILEPRKQSKLIEVPKEAPVIAPKLKREAINYLVDIYAIAQGKIDDVTLATRTVKQLDAVVGQLVSSLSKDGRAMININDLKSYDEYTYHHSLSVAVLSIAMAQHVGIAGRQLTQMGKCALMHDIGKTRVPIQIINKTSKLDEEEFTIVKGHSAEGYHYLSERGIGDEELWAGVMHHHEKIDGSGYPLGLEGDDIPLMSRIIAVADVYDALTSNRPYRKPMQPAEALEYVMGGASTFFDFDIVTAFLEKTEPYPVGCLVELSNGKIAMVINNQFAMRPVVQTIREGEILDLYNDRHCLDIVITNMFPDPPTEEF